MPPRIDDGNVFEPPGGREVNSQVLKLFVNAQTLAVEAYDALRRREEGQTMAEYGVVLGVITVILVAVFTNLSTAITGTINKVIGVLPK